MNGAELIVKLRYRLAPPLGEILQGTLCFAHRRDGFVAIRGIGQALPTPEHHGSDGASVHGIVLVLAIERLLSVRGQGIDDTNLSCTLLEDIDHPAAQAAMVLNPVDNRCVIALSQLAGLGVELFDIGDVIDQHPIKHHLVREEHAHGLMLALGRIDADSQYVFMHGLPPESRTVERLSPAFVLRNRAFVASLSRR